MAILTQELTMLQLSTNKLPKSISLTTGSISYLTRGYLIYTCAIKKDLQVYPIIITINNYGLVKLDYQKHQVQYYLPELDTQYESIMDGKGREACLEMFPKLIAYLLQKEV